VERKVTGIQGENKQKSNLSVAVRAEDAGDASRIPWQNFLGKSG